MRSSLSLAKIAL